MNKINTLFLSIVSLKRGLCYFILRYMNQIPVVSVVTRICIKPNEMFLNILTNLQEFIYLFSSSGKMLEVKKKIKNNKKK